MTDWQERRDIRLLQEMREAPPLELNNYVAQHTKHLEDYTCDYNNAFRLVADSGLLPRLRIAYVETDYGNHGATLYKHNLSFEWGNTLPIAIVRAWLRWHILKKYDPESHAFQRDWSYHEQKLTKGDSFV